MAKETKSKGLVHEELENRLLFSAGAEALLTDDNLPGDEPAIVETISTEEINTLELQENQQDGGVAKEVVFIDANVDDYELLMADLASKPNTDVFVLNDSVDGVEQISAVLANYEGLDAIHLVSHGSDASLSFGNSSLSNDNLANYAETISNWQSALNENADLLIYGCDVGSSSEGQAFISQLQSLTGTDIAASDDLTGHASLGGDWDLEYQVGEVETSLAFSTQIQSDWHGTLPAPNVSNLNGDNLNYNQGNGAVAIEQGNDVSTSRVGALTSYQSLTVSISAGGDATEDQLSIRHQGNGAGEIGFDGTRITYEGVDLGAAVGGSNGVDLQVKFLASASDEGVAALVQNITYENTDTNDATVGQRVVDFRLTQFDLVPDGDDTSTNTTLINVNAAPAAPETLNSVPGDQSVAADNTLTFSTANGNAIQITEVDGSGGDLQVSLSVSQGSLSLAGTDGLTLTKGDGLDDKSITFTGNAASINAALEGLAYNPDPDSNGAPVNFNMSTKDLDATVADGPNAKNDLSQLTINVTPVETAAKVIPPGQTNVPLEQIPDRDFVSDVVTPAPAKADLTTAEAPQQFESQADIDKANMDKADIVLDLDDEGKPEVQLPGTKSPLLNSATNQQAGSVEQPDLEAPAALDISFDPEPVVQQSEQLTGQEMKTVLDELSLELGPEVHIEQADDYLVVSTSNGMNIALTSGFVSWAIQGGSLLTALMTILPVWNTMDPLPVASANGERQSLGSKRLNDQLDAIFSGANPA